MTDTEIKGPGYRIWLDGASRTVHFEGTLRLSTGEYRPIEELLDSVLAGDSTALRLRMTELIFCNSSGINMLYKFAIAARKKGNAQVFVDASSAVPWQTKSLPNLKKFLPTITITLD